ncbi:adhesion G-protein coupled receptor G5-like [Hydra vulgaris]|uniref:Adhesion G-protein coupled receptor G5-like n=1 Tax=Hydra vulgaris TaxID=6087 RepID=A0ABM4DLU5_HYDVU
MSFPSNSSGPKECSFWRSESSIWSSDGCHNVNSNQTSYVQCECNHLTNFALILDTDQSGNNPLALQIITWIGCSISIAGLFITIICHLLFRKYQTQLAPRILIALSGNLMITLIIFLALVERTKPRILCQVVASLIQFFLLSTFCWMVVEGFNLYRMFVKVFHNSTSLNAFMLKAFAFAWGMLVISEKIGSVSNSASLVLDMMKSLPQKTFSTSSKQQQRSGNFLQKLEFPYTANVKAAFDKPSFSFNHIIISDNSTRPGESSWMSSYTARLGEQSGVILK